MLPDGYTARPAQMNDLEAALDTINAYSYAITGRVEDTVESLRVYWQSPGLDLSTDTLLVLTPQGRVAGYTEFTDRGAPHVRLIGWTCVHPEQWGRGLGKYLLEWSIQRGRRNVEKAPGDAQVVLQHFTWSNNEDAARLFKAHGFQYVRSNYIMLVEFDQPPQPPIVPEGITIRPIDGLEEERQAMYTAHQAFLDHWGNTNPPFEEYYQRFKQHIDHDPHYDPSLWFIAQDGKEFAGISMCSLFTPEDPEMAWVGTLGVMRPWRKRGIGLALLRHSFYEFYRRGKRRAGLGVDASSLTGAVRLYERAGMRVDRRMDIFELVLRPGRDLMRRSIDEPAEVAEK